MSRRGQARGFTLIELMIVVAIIGVLASIAIPSFVRMQARARQAEVSTNLKSLYTSMRTIQRKPPVDIHSSGFAPDRGNLIVVPVSEGRRGNPVLWSRRFFGELMTLDGDIGARHLIAKHAEAVAEIPVDGESAFLDIDTPQALEAARRG